MDINWGYLTQTDIGAHWADRYINFEYIADQVGKKKLAICKKGLGDYMFQTRSGKLRSLLGTSQKIEKTDGSAVFVRILYLSPDRESDIPLSKVFPQTGWKDRGSVIKGVPVPTKRLNPDTCPYSGECREYCIVTGYRMKLNTRVRYAKTWFFYCQPIVFLRLLLSEIAVYSEQSFISNMLFYPRLNGTSDILWERFIDMDSMVNDMRGLGGFYDYTKWSYKARVVQGERKGIPFPDYYHITFSVDEKPRSDQYARGWLKHGYGISIVMSKENQKKFLKMAGRYPFIVDADKTDFRFNDPPRALDTLYSKGDIAGSKGTHCEGKGLMRNEKQIMDYVKTIAHMNQDDPVHASPMMRKELAVRSTSVPGRKGLQIAPGQPVRLILNPRLR